MYRMPHTPTPSVSCTPSGFWIVSLLSRTESNARDASIMSKGYEKYCWLVPARSNLLLYTSTVATQSSLPESPKDLPPISAMSGNE